MSQYETVICALLIAILYESIDDDSPKRGEHLKLCESVAGWAYAASEEFLKENNNND